MFDRGLYDELRLKLGCLEAFPDVYEKVVEKRHLEELRLRYGPEFAK
jgi:hypothetical protein